MRSDAPISATADTILESEAGDAGVGATSRELPRGASVGRYMVLEKLGAGGMGVVYAAYDPKLDRRVALKALHTASDPERDSAGRSRLIREAKAMARLSHPNVVTVYDVLVEGEQLLIAMELVEGQSLRTWLEAKTRGWREVLGAFLQAGRGLAAAHDAGMIHRDIKLDNVLVGDDGRVRVGDFGLARSASSARGARRAPHDELGPLVSREGMLAGTPAYMAPDQLHGDPADALSDQFSFCATLYEGLYGTAPFDAADLESLVEAMESERLQPAPANSAAPGRLRAIVARGLRARPGDRWKDMHALLAALESDPSKARRRRVIAGIVAVAAIASAALVVHHRRADVLECRALERRLDGVWDDGQRRAVHDTFVASRRPYAEDTFARVAPVLDGYGRAWAKQAVAACEERVGAAESALQAQRAECMSDRFSELRAFAAVLARADGETVDRAVQGARALPALDVCAGKDPLRGHPWPGDRAMRDEARAVEEQMNVAAALLAAGRFTDGAALAAKNLAAAEHLGFRPLTASALLALAQLQDAAGDLPASEQAYHRASLAAEGAGVAQVAALAWIGEAKRAAERGDYAVADERYDHAGAWVDRVGDDDALRGELMLHRGERLSNEGKYDDARALHVKALALFERVGSDQATRALNDLGVDADLQLRYDEARGYYERALARYEQLLGPDHPNVARELNNLGLMAGDQGKFDVAIAALERANRIRERALGREHPDVAIGLNNLAFVYLAVSRYEGALALGERARPIMEKQFGADSSEMAYTLAAIAGALNGLGRPGDAIAPAEHELAIRMRGGASVNLADAQVDAGRALVASRREPARGRALLEQARATFVSLGKETRLAEIDGALKSN